MKRKYSKKWNRVWRKDRTGRKNIELEEKWRKKKELGAGGGQEEKRGNRRRGSDDLISARCHSKYSHPLSLSLSLSQSNKHTPIHHDWICVSMKSDPPPFLSPALQQPSYPVPVHVCVCDSLNHSSLTFHSRCGIDCWDTETKKGRGILFGSVQFLKLLWTKHSALFFFQAFGWIFCWETASLHGLCYWNIQFLLGFWILGTEQPQTGYNNTS